MLHWEQLVSGLLFEREVVFVQFILYLTYHSLIPLRIRTLAAKAAGKDAADGAKAGAAMGAAACGGQALLGAGGERRQARRAGRRQ